MTIKIGDRIPFVTLHHMTGEGPVEIATEALFSGKRVAIFGLPGAFTPTCSAKHLPGYVASADSFKAKGVDTIACVSVNDAFVMDAWGKDQNVGGKVMMIADGSADFSRAIGLELDLSERGFGTRCQRFSMLVDDGVVTALHVEEAGAFAVSDAETLLGDA